MPPKEATAIAIDSLQRELRESTDYAGSCRAAIRGALEALGHNSPADAYHNLDGALIDAERGWDATCMKTAKRVRSQLGMALTILADAALAAGDPERARDSANEGKSGTCATETPATGCSPQIENEIGTVWFSRREGADWELWPATGSTPKPPTVEDVSRLAPYTGEGGHAVWGGVHFHAIRFGDGNSERVWDAVNGWRKPRAVLAVVRVYPRATSWPIGGEDFEIDVPFLKHVRHAMGEGGHLVTLETLEAVLLAAERESSQDSIRCDPCHTPNGCSMFGCKNAIPGEAPK